MSETNIGGNNQQHVLDQQDVSKNVDASGGSKQQTGMSSDQERTTGPGTKSWYTDTMAGFNNILEPPSQPPVIKQEHTPEMVAKLKKFFDKLLNALKLKNPDEVADDADAQVEEDEFDDVGAVSRDVGSVNPKKDMLAKSLGESLEGISAEAEKEYAETRDPLTRTVIDITNQLDAELKKETLNWAKIDLLVSQLAILLVQKMANNDQVTVQEELKMMQKDVERVRDTYNTKWELAIGITIGAISIVGGLAGVGAGVAGMASAVTPAFMQSVKGFADGANMLTQGAGQPAQKYVSSLSESKRQLYNYELERDRSHKQTAESSQQNNKSLKNNKMNQRSSAIQAAHSAFVQIISSAA